MDVKEYFTNRSFCPLPWTGFFVQADGKVANCVMSKERIGDLKTHTIREILDSPKNREIKAAMLRGEKHKSCQGCYKLEENSNAIEGINSSRLYYLKELKYVPMDTYGSIGNFDLHHVDLRWQNTCNQSCVYCYPEYSSKWEQELGVRVPRPPEYLKADMKKLVFDNVKQLKNVYLAGGEPLLMTENEEFLDLLANENPEVSIRINTNLSKTNTKVFNKLAQFKNVHWTVSVESINQEFEYIRYGGDWFDFSENLDSISKLDHKITFNMLWLTLNHTSIFDCVDYLRYLGFTPNSFVIGPMTAPNQFDIRQLPSKTLKLLERILLDRLAKKDGYLLENSYGTMLKHLQSPFESNPSEALAYINTLDKRRKLDSKRLFPAVHTLLAQAILEKETHG